MAKEKSKYPVGWMGQMPIEEIEASTVALRPAQLKSEDFLWLKESISQQGILESLLVNPSPTTDGKYTINNGLQRFTIALQLGLKTVPVMIKEATPEDALIDQFMCNYHRVPTAPSQFGAAMKRFMALAQQRGELMTVSDLSKRLSIPAKYISDRLLLSKLTPEIASQVDSGKIPLSKAIELTKLPQNEQVTFLSQINKPIEEFAQIAAARVAEINAATREGRKAEPPQFTPILKRRAKTEIENEHMTHVVRSQVVTKGMSASDAFDLAIAWCLCVDPQSIEIAKAKWQAERDAIAARAAQRKAANAEKARIDAEAAQAAINMATQIA